MKNRKTLVIWRDDHLADPLGALFLTAPEKLDDAIVEKLKDYLGFRVKLLRVTISGNRVEVEAESQELHEESERLVAAARGLRAKRLNRSAMTTIEEALKLDPLNGDAYRELGATLAAAGRGKEAIAALIRARETLGDSAALLIEIANACLAEERISAAVAYLERAHKLEPRNFVVRRALTALGRKQRSSRIRPDDESSAKAGGSTSASADTKAKSQVTLNTAPSEVQQSPPARGNPGESKGR